MLQPLCLPRRSTAAEKRYGKWAVSPDSSDEILSLEFELDFGLLVDLSCKSADQLECTGLELACY